MNNRVVVRFAGGVVIPNENGELQFESGAGTKTNIHADEVHRRALEAQSLEEMLEIFKESGAYIGAENSRVLILETDNGTIIFSKDEPSRKLIIDKKIPEASLEQILSINDYDNGRAIEKILVGNGVIEDPRKEIEEVVTYDDTRASFERDAKDVDLRNVNENTEIGEARAARDMTREDRYSGIYSEEDRRRMEEERMRKIREERANGDKEEGFVR